MSVDARIERIRKHIPQHDDYPKPGIRFRDIFPIFYYPDVMIDLVDILKEYITKYSPHATALIGIEAKGFLFCTILAKELKMKFVPVRKKGKLPGEVEEITYYNTLIEGEETRIISKDALKPGERAIIVEDIIMGGGMISTTCQLVKNVKANIDAVFCIMHLVDQGGRDKVEAYAPLYTLMEFNK